VTASTGTTVAMLVAVLVLLGLGMIVLALWLVRSTRSDPQALGPLEVMGDRRWRKGDADRRQANLDTARPAGAWPPAPMVAFESGDGDTAGPNSDVTAAEGEAAEDTVGEPAAAGDGDAGVEDSSDVATADGEAVEGSVAEPATADGDAGDEEDTSDGAVSDGDATEGDGAAPSMEESTVSSPTAESEPPDERTAVETDKKE
jgi:hypothetical protein